MANLVDMIHCEDVIWDQEAFSVLLTTEHRSSLELKTVIARIVLSLIFALNFAKDFLIK